MIQKAFQFRIYPSLEQMSLIQKTLGCVRFVFNFFLAKQQQKDTYWHLVEEMKQSGQLPSNEWKGSSFNKFESIKAIRMMKQHYPFLKEVDSISLQKSVENLNDVYTRYYKKQNNEPHYKSKRNPVQSYTTKQTNGNIEVLDNCIKLPKLGWVRFAKSREVEGRIINSTIRRNAAGKYFVSILCETDVQPLPKNDNAIGIDLGIKTFAVCSDGQAFVSPKHLLKYEKQLVFWQRRLSRRTKGRANWQKAKLHIARIHERIANCRKDFLHKLSTKLIRENQTICLEDLQVNNLMKNHQLAKSIAEVSWAMFRTFLTYKSKWYGRNLSFVAKNFPSSQLCHVCGTRNPNVKHLALRAWTCSKCGTQHDRDDNASQNIKQEGIRLLIG